jgi:hypothetical protein
MEVRAVDRTVAHLNIERYRRLLKAEMNETKRQTLLRLLAEEVAKLAAVRPPQPGEPEKGTPAQGRVGEGDAPADPYEPC